MPDPKERSLDENLKMPVVDFDIENTSLTFIFFDEMRQLYKKYDNDSHYHTFWELHLVLEGKIDCVFDGTKQILTQGDLMLIAPNVHHRMYSDNQVIRFSAGIAYCKNKKENCDDFYSYFNKHFKFNGYKLLKADEAVLKIIKNFNFILMNKPIQMRARIRNCLSDFVLKFCDLFEKDGKSDYEDGLKSDFKFEFKILKENRKLLLDNYFSSCYSENIPLSDLAANMFLCQKQLSRIIKNLYGRTYSEQITFLRIEKGQKLLRETDFSIKKIASAVGYETAEGFNKAFKRLKGISPTEYKKQLKI